MKNIFEKSIKTVLLILFVAIIYFLISYHLGKLDLKEFGRYISYIISMLVFLPLSIWMFK